MNKKVLIAMSGGVDSSVTALLIKNQGYECMGATMNLFQNEDPVSYTHLDVYKRQQLDFCLPAKFNLTYIDSNNEKQTPVVLHRAILGSLDRFMAYLLEETKGNLPTWLAPEQVRILPVKTDDEKLSAYADEVYNKLFDKDVREMCIRDSSCPLF